MMTKDDFSRRFKMTVCAAGTVHIYDSKERAGHLRGTLPVFSTDTLEQAEKIRVYHCRLARDGSNLYTLNSPPKNVEDLDGVSDMFRAHFERMKARAA